MYQLQIRRRDRDCCLPKEKKKTQKGLHSKRTTYLYNFRINWQFYVWSVRLKHLHRWQRFSSLFSFKRKNKTKEKKDREEKPNRQAIRRTFAGERKSWTMNINSSRLSPPYISWWKLTQTILVLGDEPKPRQREQRRVVAHAEKPYSGRQTYLKEDPNIASETGTS